MKFIKRYSIFNENMELAKSIIGKKMEAFEKLKVLLSKNLGYIGKFTEYLMDENVAYDDLVELYDKIIDLKSKNTTIDISKLNYEKALDKIIMLNNDLIVNSLLSKFPSEQKKIIKERITRDSKKFSFNEVVYNLLLKVARKENLSTFISKISRYKDFESLTNALKIFSKDPTNEREQVKSLINDIKSDIVFENDNILIIKVDSLSDINLLGPDTSWCILHSGQWNSYTKGRLQYILYDYTKDDFDPLFKIGFTLEKSGIIYAAHNILDGGASSELRRILEENSLTTTKLLPEVKKIDLVEIDSINSRTTTESLKLLVNNLSIDDKLIMTKLITKLFDIFGYRRATKTGIVNRTINTAKKLILKSLINKYFNESKLITIEDCDKVDLRLIKYIKEYEILLGMLVDSKIFRISPLKSDAIAGGLDIWTDQIIVNYISNIIPHYILYRGVDYTKPIPDDKWLIRKEVLSKLSDRLNKIYSENKVKFSDDRHRNDFNYKVIFLNYILGRPDTCPDKEELLKSVPSIAYTSLPGLFSKKIDISNTFLSLGQFSKGFPTDLIEKKDYPKTSVYFDSYGLLNDVPDLLKHLDGYELMLNITRDKLKYILTSGTSATFQSRLDEYGKKVFELLKKFPKRVYKDSFVTDGKLKIVVRE